MGQVRDFGLENLLDVQRLQPAFTTLSTLQGLVVIDEVQRAPDLFPVLRVLIDRSDEAGQYLLLGSASPMMLRQASESSPGRVEVIEVAGFDLAELAGTSPDLDLSTDVFDRLWLRRGFPRAYLAASDEDSWVWRRQAISSHVEPDLPHSHATVTPHSGHCDLVSATGPAMKTNRSLHSCSFLACTGCSAALAQTAIDRMWRSVVPLIASLCLVAYAALPPTRMALPADLETARPLPLEGLGAGRSGRFVLEGQAVTFRRMGDVLSVFDSLRLDRVSVEFEHAGAKGRCDGRAAAAKVGIVDTPVQPLALNCRFTGPVPGELLLKEPRLADAGARQAREGQATFGAVAIDIRSEHALTGSPLPLAQPAGYRFMIQGRDVAALDLAGGTPVLRRTAGLDEGMRTALTQVALALGLLSDPAVTLG